MSVRFFCLSAALWLVACGISSSVDFGPGASPLGHAGESARGGTAASGAPSAGQSGAVASGSGGVSGGGSGSEPVAGGGNASAGAPPNAGAAGDEMGGAAGEPSATPEPVCGNGIIEAGEECDASSASDHDGCNAQCRVACAEHGTDVLASSDHHCYAGYGEKEFAQARQDCESRGAHLATISSVAENELVAPLINESKYLGAFEDVPLTSEGSGEYHWITGEPLSFENWADGEPDQAESRCSLYGPGPAPSLMRCYEHCMAMVTGGRWVDQRCDRVDGYVCEWEPVGSK